MYTYLHWILFVEFLDPKSPEMPDPLKWRTDPQPCPQLIPSITLPLPIAHEVRFLSTGNPDPTARRSVQRPAETKSREPSSSSAAERSAEPGSATTRGRPETAARRSIRKGLSEIGPADVWVIHTNWWIAFFPIPYLWRPVMFVFSVDKQSTEKA